MEGTLKADLRNTRTLLGLLEEGALRQRLEQLVHDVTAGLRAQCPPDLDVDALRRLVAAEAPAAAHAHRIADDTLHQLARSLDRVLPWWSALPPVETLLDDARWPTAPTGPVIELRVTADERFRLRGLHGTRDALRAHFEKYVSKHPGVEALRLLDDTDQPVVILVADDRGEIRLAG